MRKNKLLEAHIRECSYEIFFVVDKTEYGTEIREYWDDILEKIRQNGLQASVSTDTLWKRASGIAGWSVIVNRK